MPIRTIPPANGMPVWQAPTPEPELPRRKKIMDALAGIALAFSPDAGVEDVVAAQGNSASQRRERMKTARERKLEEYNMRLAAWKNQNDQANEQRRIRIAQLNADTSRIAANANANRPIMGGPGSVPYSAQGDPLGDQVPFKPPTLTGLNFKDLNAAYEEAAKRYSVKPDDFKVNMKPEKQALFERVYQQVLQNTRSEVDALNQALSAIGLDPLDPSKTPFAGQEEFGLGSLGAFWPGTQTEDYPQLSDIPNRTQVAAPDRVPPGSAGGPDIAAQLGLTPEEVNSMPENVRLEIPTGSGVMYIKENGVLRPL